MSSYGNHIWTEVREDMARRLVTLAYNCDDDGFAQEIHALRFAPDELIDVTALLAEGLADVLGTCECAALTESINRWLKAERREIDGNNSHAGW